MGARERPREKGVDRQETRKRRKREKWRRERERWRKREGGADIEWVDAGQHSGREGITQSIGRHFLQNRSEKM